MNTAQALPDGWQVVSLGEIAEIRAGGTPDRGRSDYFGGGIPWVKSGELRDRVVDSFEETISDEGLANSAATIFPKGTVCIALYGATVGKLGILGIDAATNQAVCGIKLPEEINRLFIYYYLTSVRNWLIKQGKGGAQSNISGQIVKAMKVPLPAADEQFRIVEKIEELFSDLDAGVAALKRAQANLKRYRAAVLKAAVEGRLTEQWRAERKAKGIATEPAAQLLARILAERRKKWEAAQLRKFADAGKAPTKGWQDKFPESAVPDTNGLALLAEGWCWARVDHLGDVQLGRQRSPKDHQGPNMRPYLRVANVFEDRIDTSDVMTMNFTDREFQTFELKPGDILLNEGQSLELVGRSAIYRGEFPGACFTNTLVRFRTYDGLLTEFAQIVFRAYLRNGRFQKIAGITVNLAHLGAGRFAELEFPLPSMVEQLEVVKMVETALSKIDNAETEIKRSLERAARLRQAILKRAFEGRLV